MKKLDLGQSIGAIANVGVLLGIFLLVYELNQTRQINQAQTRTTIAEGITDFLVTINGDEELASLWQRGNAGEELSDAERSRHDSLRNALNRYFENAHYQYRIGLYDEGEFAGQKRRWRGIFSQKGVADHWCRTRQIFSPEFTAEIDQLLTTYSCE